MDNNYENERDQMRTIISNQDQQRKNFIENLRQQYSEQINQYEQEKENINKQIQTQHSKTMKLMQQQDCVQLQMQKDLESSQNSDISETMNQAEQDEKRSESELLGSIQKVFSESKGKMAKLTDLRIQNEKDEQNIIQRHEIQEVNKAYSGQMQECYNKKLGDPEQREDYINEKCKSLVATKSSSIVKGRIMFELENCMDDGNFCNVCCVTNAGVTGGPRMSQCMDKCDEALQRKVVPEMSVNFKLSKLRDPIVEKKENKAQGVIKPIGS